MSDKNTSITKLRLIGGVYLVLFIIGINSVCTQFIASRLGHHSAFGQPLFGMLYSPFDWWRWLFRFYDYAPTTYNYAFIIFALGILIALVTFVLWVGFKARSSRKHEDVHGTAILRRWMKLRRPGFFRVRGSRGRASIVGLMTTRPADEPTTFAMMAPSMFAR